jgi:hypothetical protein
MRRKWWARRKGAFAHPTVSVGQFDLVELQFGKVETQWTLPVHLHTNASWLPSLSTNSKAVHMSSKRTALAENPAAAESFFPTIFEEAPLYPAGIRGLSWLTESLEEAGNGSEYGGQARPQGATAETDGGAEAAA